MRALRNPSRDCFNIDTKLVREIDLMETPMDLCALWRWRRDAVVKALLPLTVA